MAAGRRDAADRRSSASCSCERLRATLENAYDNVPFYRKKLDELGVKPGDVSCHGDVADLPFTTKIDLRDHYPFGMFARPRDQIVRVHASSGTTGNPTTVGYTRGDIDVWGDLIARTLAAGGVARATCSRTPSATASSPAGSACTSAPSAWAAPSCPSPAATPSGSSRSCATSAPPP